MRINANLAALEVAIALCEEGRPATDSEQVLLDGYSSWGAVPEIFDTTIPTFAAERERLQNLLTVEDYDAARRTTLTAFFTHPAVTTAMWQGLTAAGYEGGRVLEPGCGTGNFLATAPVTADVVGVEIDPISALIASARHPEAQIRREDFAAFHVADDSFVATIGNVPFDQAAPYDPDRNRAGLSTHNYFLSKSIDLTAPGGYVSVITSTHTADARRAGYDARQAFTERADFITGLRLPSGKDGAFADHAGTEIATDILVFRVREEHQEPTARTRLFLDTVDHHLDGHDLRINRFFADNPDHILGTPQVVSGRFGPQLHIDAQGNDITVIAAQIEQILTADFTAARAAGLGQTADLESLAQAGHIDTVGLIEQADTALEQVPGTVRYTRDPDGTLSFEQLLQDDAGIDYVWQPVTPVRKYAEQWAQLIDLRGTTTALLTACSENAHDDIRTLRSQLNAQYDAYAAAYGPINLHEVQSPRKRTEKQIAKDLARLEAEWRADNAIGDRPYEGPLPEEERQRLLDEASQPIQDPTPVRRHLQGALASDPFMTTVTALEHYNEDTKQATKAALFTTNPIRTVEETEQAETLADALTLLAHSSREITADNLAELLGEGRTAENVTAELEHDHLAFRDPARPDIWIPAPTYLSGPVRTKLAAARDLAENDPRFIANAAALEKALPEKITQGITINLGATWIPEEIYTQFLIEAFHIPESRREQIKLAHVGDQWKVTLPKTWPDQARADLEWGVRAANAQGEFNYQTNNSAHRRYSHHGVAHAGYDATVFSAAQAMEAAMNMAPPRLNYSMDVKLAMGLENPKQSVFNPDATRFAGRKVDELTAHFQTWAMSEPARHAALIDAYNDAFNNVVAPVYDGTDRLMPGMSEKYHPYAYQLNAVERIVNEEAVLLNHVVGAGKTGSMIMGAMELRRLGLVSKPMMVVPNHLVEQIAREAKQWYPGASVLSGAAARGDAKRRGLFLSQAALHDWDLIVVPESVFRRIPVSPQIEHDYLNRQLRALRNDLETLKEHGVGQKMTVKDMERTIKAREQALAVIAAKIGTDVGVTFDQAGIDYLIVDEAHGYKNLARYSALRDLAHPGSQKATDMDMKLSYLRTLKGPGHPVVTFASGTPISNQIAELWVMQHYLRPDLLTEAGIAGVSSWGVNFTEKVTEIDFTAAGAIKESTKLSRYVNVGDLARMCTPFMDYVGRDQITAALPDLVGGATQVVEFDPGQEVKDFNRDLLWREDQLQAVDNPRIDNPLKLINDGKTATLDPRLAGLDHTPGIGRVHAITTEVERLWREHQTTIYLDQHGDESPRPGGFQIVFCDRGVPNPDGFTVYDAIRDDLVARGMDRDRIRFIHDWDDRRLQLFDDCNNGQVDVLIGNTEKLGTGANIQSRCVAIHHADVPWRPADLEQRLGRGLRQGNQNPQLFEAVYIGAGTHDAFSWGAVSRKARFIEQFYRADQELRDMEPLEGSGDAMAHHKAIATGNPAFVRQMELQRRVADLESGQMEHDAMKASTERELVHSRTMLPQQETLAVRLGSLAPTAQTWVDLPSDQRTWTVNGTTYTKRTDATAALTATLAEVARDRQIAPVTVATIGGVDMQARYSYENSALILSGPAGTHPDGVPENLVRDDLHRTPEENQTLGQKRSGFLSRLESGVNSVIIRAQWAQRDLDQIRDTISKLENQPEVGEYPRIQELHDARHELQGANQQIAQFNSSAAERQAQSDYEARLAAKGRVHGFSLELNPTSYMIEEGIAAHPKSPASAAVDEHGWIVTDPATTLVHGRSLLDLIEPAPPGAGDQTRKETMYCIQDHERETTSSDHYSPDM